MKNTKLRIGLAIILATAMYTQGFSQSSPGKNHIKTNLSALFFKGFGLQYERQLGRKTTVGLGMGIIPKTSLPFAGTIEEQIDDPNVRVSDFRLGTTILTPEFRYYFSKKGAFHGFYLAPYARLGWYNLQGPISFTSSNGQPKLALFSGKLNTVMGGLMAGSSFALSEKLYLDWWIIGASFGGANGDLRATVSLDNFEKQSLEQVLRDIEIAGTEIESQVTNNGATVTTTGSMAGIRGLGINLGIRF